MMILQSSIHKLAHDLPLLPLLLFFSKPFLFLSNSKFGFVRKNGKKRRKKWFYNLCFLTSFQVLCFLGVGKMERKGRKMAFISCFPISKVKGVKPNSNKMLPTPLSNYIINSINSNNSGELNI